MRQDDRVVDDGVSAVRVGSAADLIRRRRSIVLGAAGAALGTLSLPAAGQLMTDRTIVLVVPFAPGGTTDYLGRVIANRLAQVIKRSIRIDNRPGAGTAVAAEWVARAKPDGHTLLLASSSTLVFNPLMGGASRYDPVNDFTGISMLAQSPFVMLVPETLGVTTVDEFVARARQANGSWAYGSAGQGSSLHLAAELFMSIAGLRMTHVPYKGSAQALTALTAGDIKLYFDLFSTSRPLIRGGQLKAIAVTGRDRTAALPGVPTLIESGFEGFEVTSSFAVVAPRSTPAGIVSVFNRAIISVVSDMQLTQHFSQIGLEVAGSEPEAVALHFAQERSRWGPLIASRSFRVDNNN